jgi:peptide chain release factor 2
MGLNLPKWGTHFDVEGLIKRAQKLTEQSYAPDFWEDGANAQKVLKEAKELETRAGAFAKLQAAYEDVQVLIQLAREEGGEDLLPEIKEAAAAFEAEFHGFSAAILLSGEYDGNNAILSLHAGAGGTEACDWVAMLTRMYTRWAEARDFTVNLLDYLDGDEAGIKSATLEIIGPAAYGHLKGEAGVHRLIRLSPFDTAGKRHTSFASCSVLPEVADDKTIEINPDDLRIDTYRASGAGGQHVNKTDSAIRITHLPTGIVVQCQNERSQHKNRDVAMKMLRAKLLELKMQEQNKKITDLRGDVKDINFGAQIRTYTMHPYSLVKDHRTGAETGNVAAVMDGSLDIFVNAYLHWLSSASN